MPSPAQGTNALTIVKHSAILSVLMRFALALLFAGTLLLPAAYAAEEPRKQPTSSPGLTRRCEAPSIPTWSSPPTM